ncbi:hypothetical protein J2857_003596 [Neorhizobium galegae]|uniref:hypothetical protein n=1 Tax=Neorhizobium galegae TaxID=399 RepID=UPI001AE89927|nr:hypothetical protein [Neorhizobium galegae]MBP2560827.1 hypothetical protein [Neorhizobium galegae]
MSGGIAVGAVFPPVRPGLRWRWRCWVTGRSRPSEGSLHTEALARRAVEAAFANFLKNAGLVPTGSEAE